MHTEEEGEPSKHLVLQNLSAHILNKNFIVLARNVQERKGKDPVNEVQAWGKA